MTRKSIHTSTKKAMPDLANFITTKEAAAELGFHINHIRRMVRRGDLKTKRVGQMLFISMESVTAYQRKTRGFEKHSPVKRSQPNKK